MAKSSKNRQQTDSSSEPSDDLTRDHSHLGQRVFGMYREAYSGLPREVWFLSFSLFVNRCGAMVLAFFTLYLTKERGFSELSAGLMMSVYGVGAIAGNYVGGRLTDRVGAVRLQVILLFLAAPMFLIVPFCYSWWSIAVSFFILSFFFEAVRPPNATAVAQFTPTELHPRAFALQRMAVNLGFSFGPFIGGYLAQVDYFLIFLVDATTTVLGVLILIHFFGIKRYSKTMTDQQKAALDDAENRPKTSPLRDFRFVVFLGLLLATATVFFQLHGMYPIYMADHFGLSEPGIGKLYAINTLLIVVFEMILIDKVSKYRALRVIAWGAFLSCLGFGILPFSSAIWFCAFSMVIITFGEMLTMPVCSAWVGQRSERGHRAMYMGWYSMTYSLAAVISPGLGGLIYQYNKDVFWYASIGVALLVLVGFYWLSGSVKQESLESEPATV